MPAIRTAVRTGDTLAHERRAMLTRPPHILVTTPESLYILLTAGEEPRNPENGRDRDRRRNSRRRRRQARRASRAYPWSAWTRSPARPRRASAFPPRRSPSSWSRNSSAGIGRPRARRSCKSANRRELDLAVEVPGSELGPVASNEMWGEIYDRIAAAGQAASLDADLRQHAPPGRARGACTRRASGQRRGGRASRQPVAQAAPRRRNAS